MRVREVVVLCSLALVLEVGSICNAGLFVLLISLLSTVAGLTSEGFRSRTLEDVETVLFFGVLLIAALSSIEMLGVLPSSVREGVFALSDGLISVVPICALLPSVRESVFELSAGLMLFVPILELSEFVSGTLPVDDEPFPLAGILGP